MHAHVIVSRMDRTQTISLSPLTNSKGNTNMLNGKEVKNGFSRTGWQVESCDLFCKKYRYIATAGERSYIKNKLLASYKNKILQEIMEDMKEERQTINNVRKIASTIKSPKKMMKGYLKKVVRDILSERNNEL